MPLADRYLEDGTVLTARYKGKERTCKVVADGNGVCFRLDDGQEYKSPSSAGRAVTGGVAVNGWKFWSLEGDLKPAKERKPKAAKSDKPAKPKAVKPKATKKGAKKTATKKAARAASHDSFGCGVCPETFPTLKAATEHALTHTQS